MKNQSQSEFSRVSRPFTLAAVLLWGCLFAVRTLTAGPLDRPKKSNETGDAESGSGQGPGKYQKELLLGNVSPQLAGLSGSPLDPFAREKVYYGQMGIPQVDTVCKNVAVFYGSLKVAEAMVADSQDHLRRFALDHMSQKTAAQEQKEAKQEQKDSVAQPKASDQSPGPATGATISSTSPALSDEEIMAELKTVKEKKGHYTKEEIKYFSEMTGNLAAAALVLARGVEAAVQLYNQVQNLITSAPSMFMGTQALKLPHATANLKLALQQIEVVPKQGKDTLVALAKYAEMIKALHEESKDDTPVD